MIERRPIPDIAYIYIPVEMNRYKVDTNGLYLWVSLFPYRFDEI